MVENKTLDRNAAEANERVQVMRKLLILYLLRAVLGCDDEDDE